MRPPTANEISQKKHGIYNAVDYRAKDENNNWRKEIYAPCDMRISFYGDNGNAGKQIQAFDTAGRRHGFAHTESCAVAVGTNVKKGQLIGIMGYTGLTDPDNVPDGTHLHWTIRLADGNTYVYPPTLITEPFGSEREQMTKSEAYTVVDGFYRWGTNVPPTPQQSEYWADRLVNVPTGLDELYQAMKKLAEDQPSFIPVEEELFKKG